eukprot:gene10888-7745_t
MGVPAFYRWISEKYAKIVVNVLEQFPKVVGDNVIPVDLTEPNPNGVEFDNLYVDMNGLIHPCSHPEDREAPSTEEEMYRNVTKYIDRLVSAVRPRKVLFLAIDGVAPRAKMNQQRSRRFRAAQEAKEKKELMEEVVQEMVAEGFDAPERKGGDGWDSNVITPGTEFMTKISVFVKHYILERMNSDKLWRGLTVVFSDASVPGEGEHKIMDYIRSQRNQPGYDPNTHHVLHGLDADLIMLALATHEARFTILREKVFFGRKERDNPDDESNLAQRALNSHSMLNDRLVRCADPADEWVFAKPLQALHVHVLREYLEAEFSSLRQTLPFAYDLERIIDDFIFMCFFVGNDFLPHLPSLDIRDGALDFLVQCYKDILPSLGDYVTAPGGVINLSQADVLLSRVGEVEDQIFLHAAQALRQSLLGKRPRADVEAEPPTAEAPTAADGDVAAAAERPRQNAQKGGADAEAALKERLKAREQQQIERYKVEVADGVRLHEQGWKERYYGEPFKREDLERGGGLRRMCVSYVQGLCWVMSYYYRGVPSWNWYYPFHYAPFASDLVNIDSYGAEVAAFALSQPFRPLEQLLAVLPASSAHALPAEVQWLMTTPESPIVDLYSDDVPIDPNGKHLPWLWILLLPFLDESRVVGAFDLVRASLSLDARRRNSLGPAVLFAHAATALGSFMSQHAQLQRAAPETDADVRAALDPSHSFGDADGDGDAVNDAPLETVACTCSETGVAAVLAAPPQRFLALRGALVRPPAGSERWLAEIERNEVLVAQLQLPEPGAHRSALLPGAVPPESPLMDHDLLPRRPPRLNRSGFNVLDLFQSVGQQRQSQYGGRIESERQSRYDRGRDLSRYDGGRGASQAPAQAAFEETSFVPQLTRIGAQQSSRGASQPQSRGGSFTQQQQQRRGLLSISQQLQQPVAKAGFSFTHPSNTAQQAPPAPHFSHLSSQTRYPPQQPPYQQSPYQQPPYQQPPYQQPPYQQPPYQQYQQYQQPPLEPYGGGASTAAAQNPASIQKLREAMMETLMRRK